MANSSFFTGNPTPQELASIEEVLADAASNAFEVSEAAEQAVASAAAAANSASQATAARADSVAAKAGAETSAANAATSATSASTNATAAAASASTASTAATTSTSAASTASARATDAENAANTASSRAADANAAKIAAEAARDAAVAAKDQSVTAKNEAVAAKVAAELAEDNSEFHRGISWQHSQESLGFRNEAEGFKNQAATSATSAAGSATTATTKASEASASAGAASTSATASANSATASNAAKVASESARDASVTAKNNAVAARDAALTAETNAETAQAAALVSEANAWTSRQEAYTARNEAETFKNQAQTAKAGAETHQGYAWGYRNEAETFRNQAEVFKNQAAASAEAVGLFDPNNYVPKAGGAYTGLVYAPGLRITGAVGPEGGEVHFAKPITDTTLAGDVIADVVFDKFRFFENGGSFRGVHIDLAQGAPGAAANIWHSGNLNPDTLLPKIGGTLTGPLEIQHDWIGLWFKETDGVSGSRGYGVGAESGIFRIARLDEAGDYQSDLLAINRASGLAGFTGDVASSGSIYAANLVQVRIEGRGYTALVPGNTDNPGYVAFHKPDGGRAGYIGWQDGTNRLAMTAEGGWGWTVNGQTVFNQAVTAPLLDFSPIGAAGSEVWRATPANHYTDPANNPQLVLKRSGAKDWQFINWDGDSADGELQIASQATRIQGNLIVEGEPRLPNNTYITGPSPTLRMVDTDNVGAQVHVNEGNLYVLNASGAGSEGWASGSGDGGRWPLVVDLNSGDVHAGRNITFGNSGGILQPDGNLYMPWAGRFLNEEFGLYTKKSDFPFATPEMFNSTAGTGGDDTAAIQAAINTGKHVVLDSNKEYRITSGISLINKPGQIFTGGKIRVVGNFNAITVIGCHGVVIDISLLCSQQTGGYALVFQGNSERCIVRRLHILDDGFNGIYVQQCNCIHIEFFYAINMRGDTGINWYGSAALRSDLLNINFAAIAAHPSNQGLIGIRWNGNCNSMWGTNIHTVNCLHGMVINNTSGGPPPQIGRFTSFATDFSYGNGIQINAGDDFDFFQPYINGAGFAAGGTGKHGMLADGVGYGSVRVFGGKSIGNFGHGLASAPGVGAIYANGVRTYSNAEANGYQLHSSSILI